MQITKFQTSNTLLTYSPMTSPSPVQVSPPTSPLTSPSVATLTFVVSCPKSVLSAMVSQIIITIPVDEPGNPEPTNLAETAPPPSAASISSTGSDQWVPTAGVPGVFIFTPKNGQPVQIAEQSLTIAFTGIQINQLVGTALVTIKEWAAPSTTSPPPVTGPPSGSATVAIPKFPYGFFAGNFTTTLPLIPYNETATLSWVGSVDATYTMLYGPHHPEDVSKVRTWTSKALTDATTFILEVSAQEAGQTVTLYFSLTVIVANPSITATDLTVLTTATFDGAVAVGAAGAPANLTLNGDLNAKGDVDVGGNLSTGANLSLPGGWVFSVDSSGNLNLSDHGVLKFQVSPNGNVVIPGQSLTLDTWTLSAEAIGIGSLTFSSNQSGGSVKFDGQGDVFATYVEATGLLVSNGKRALCDQDPINIYLGPWNSYLNATAKFGEGAGAKGYKAAAYWMHNPDKESNLQINYGNPFQQPRADFLSGVRLLCKPDA